MLEVNISELGLVTSGGKVVWGKYAQVASFPVDIIQVGFFYNILSIYLLLR